jgi:HlyD family secretion protein
MGVKNDKKKRLVRWLVGTVVVAAILVFALWPSAVEVEVGVVSAGALEVTLDEEGETRVRDRFVISAPVAGRVERIEHEPGDRVVGGETVLATFRPSAPVPLDARSRAEAEAGMVAAQAAQGRAQAQRQQAAAELAYARAELQRIVALAAAGIVSKESLEQAQLALDTREEALGAAEFAVQSAAGEVRAARARLMQAEPPRRSDSEVIELRSPIDGVVLRVLRESEAVVLAGDALLEVGAPEDLEVIADYLSSDAVRIRPGYRAMIERWGGEPILATVRRVEPSGFTKISALGVEEQRVNVILDVDPTQQARWSALGDGFRVEVRVVVWADDRVVSVPIGALIRDAGKWAVYAVVDGRVRLTGVEIGERNDQRAQLLSGLEVGDQVVVYPSEQLVDGTRVKVKAAA